MGVSELKNGQVVPFPPPTNKKLEVKNKFLLVLELIWLLVLILPYTLLSLFRTLFPPAGKSLKGQVALVTGAGRGLGRGLALGLAKEGCKVAVVDVNRENAMQTAEDIVNGGGVAKAYFSNVAKVEEVRELRATVTRDLGVVDILVNNAGLIYGDSLDNSTEEAIRAVISVNLTSHFWMAREFLPPMKERNSGHIVAIASIASFMGMANGSAYVASKFGVRGFMEAVRNELQADSNNRVRTTTVFPYFINTSALYVDHWDIRIPPMSIEETVEATICGVKRDEVSVTIPAHLYAPIHVSRLVPQAIIDRALQVFYVRIKPPTQEQLQSTPTAAIISDLAKHNHDSS